MLICPQVYAYKRKCYDYCMVTIGRQNGRFKTKLIHHRHTGRLREHRHTSYGSLMLVLFLAIIPIAMAQNTLVAAETGYPSISNSSETLAVVPWAIPTSAPTITTLADGRTFSTNDSITVAGTCQKDMVVKVFKNDVLAGAANCRGNGYSLPIDLFMGTNAITAKQYNHDEIAGPASAPITVRLTQPTPGTAKQTAASSQFFITTDALYRGVKVNDIARWPITISGGQAPYLVTVNWGDGQTQDYSRGTDGQFLISHIYDGSAATSGSFTVTVKARDKNGDTRYLQLAAFMPPQSAAAYTSDTGSTTIFRYVWQGMAMSALIILSFWIGERRELTIMKQHYGA